MKVYAVTYNHNGHILTSYFSSKKKALAFYHTQERADKPYKAEIDEEYSWLVDEFISLKEAGDFNV